MTSTNFVAGALATFLFATGGGVSLAHAAAGRADALIQCNSYDKQPMLECVVRVTTRDGKPLTGAVVTLGAMMPSMPMAHHVKPVMAIPTGQSGEYKGTMELEMLGVWAVEVDVSGSVRDKITRHVNVVACKAGDRCPAVNIKPGEKPTEHSPHGSKSAPGAHKH